MRTAAALATLGIAATLSLACGDSAPGHPQGTEGGACYADHTCDDGLDCVGDLCVAAGSPDAGSPLDAPLSADAQPGADAVVADAAASCVDGDGDGHFALDPVGCPGGDDNCDDDGANHTVAGCACIDADLDGYGATCDLGPDCDDDPLTGAACNAGCVTGYRDGDGDGYGDGASPVTSCTAVVDGTDCDDLDAAEHPDVTWYPDADGDTYGAGADPGSPCQRAHPADVTNSDDCDDASAAAATCHVGCGAYFADADGDSYGDPLAPISACGLAADVSASSDDCNDGVLGGAAFHPAAAELCDGMDNDCDGVLDEGCVGRPPVADAGPDQVVTARYNPTWLTVDGNGSTDPDGPAVSLTYAWSCSAGTLGAATSAATWLTIPCTVPGDSDVICTLTVDDGSATDTDTMTIHLQNAPPVADVAGTHLPTGEVLIRLPSDASGGTRVILDGSPSYDPDNCQDPTLVYSWTGADAAGLSSPSVESPTLDNVAGTYHVTLHVTDSDGATASRDVTLVFSPCVYVGTSCPAAIAGCRLVNTSSGGMTDRVTEALGVADLEDYAEVCLMQGTYTETAVTLLDGVAVRGGYNATWGRSDNSALAVVQVRDAAGVVFPPGVVAALDTLTVRPDLTGPVAAVRAAVTVNQATASVENCAIVGDNGSSDPAAAAYGVRIVAGSAATPVLLSGNPAIRGSDTTSPVTSVGVSVGGGAQVYLLGSPAGFMGRLQSIYGGPADDAAYAVRVDGAAGARLVAQDNYIIEGCEWTDVVGRLAVAVYLDGGAGHVVERSEQISGGRAPTSFGVLTHDTTATIIGDNHLVEADGALVSAAIADGWMGLDGVPVPGASHGLTIERNLRVWGNNLHQSGATTVLATGILLVGTRGATVADNGQRLGAGYGDFVIGGVVTNVDGRPAQALAPVAPALWTLATDGVRVERSFLHSGFFTDVAGAELPAVAVLDGSPADPTGALASTGLALDANAIVADMPAIDGPAVMLNHSMAVRLLGTPHATLTSNVIATMSGNHLYGVVLEGASAALVNNTIDLDLILRPGDACPTYLARMGVFGVEAAPGSELVNNVVLVRQLFDVGICGGLKLNTDEAGVWLVDGSGAGTVPFDRLEHNLFFIERDDLGTSGTPDYVVVATDRYDAAPTVLAAYPANALNAIPGVAADDGNGVADPLLVDGSTAGNRAKGELRVSPASPGVDRGQPVGAPDHDYAGAARPASAGVDIGHLEQ